MYSLLWILIKQSISYVYSCNNSPLNITSPMIEDKLILMWRRGNHRTDATVWVLTRWLQGLWLKTHTHNLLFLSRSRGSLSATHITAVKARLEITWQLHLLCWCAFSTRVANMVPVLCAGPRGCTCRSDECCGLSEVEIPTFPLLQDRLPASAAPVCSSLR